MPKRIKYQLGEQVGDYGIIYLCDVGYYMGSGNGRIRIAKFKCAKCGNEFETRISSVKHGRTKSCGCININKETLNHLTHGMSKHPLYKKWSGIKRRCYNPNEPSFERYGARGIRMCEEWKNNPKVFIDYVIQLPYAMVDEYSIDRINTYGNYEPENVRWATKHEQAANQRIRKGNTSGYIGVWYNKTSQKWQAGIGINKKNIHLGYFNTKEEAVIARNNYIIEHGLTEYKIQEIK